MPRSTPFKPEALRRIIHQNGGCNCMSERKKKLGHLVNSVSRRSIKWIDWIELPRCEYIRINHCEIDGFLSIVIRRLYGDINEWNYRFNTTAELTIWCFRYIHRTIVILNYISANIEWMNLLIWIEWKGRLSLLCCDINYIQKLGLSPWLIRMNRYIQRRLTTLKISRNRACNRTFHVSLI